MKNKILIKAVILLLVFANFSSVFAFDDCILSFENGTDGWIRVSNSGEINTEYADLQHKNALYVNSPGVLAKYRLNLENPVTADNMIYSLSYDVMIPGIKSETTKQTVSVCGLGSNSVMGFYGLRIDNGEVSYANGYNTTGISTAYSGGEALKISEGVWHNLKTVYNRASGIFTYYVDNAPLRTQKGDILRVKAYEKIENYKITKLELVSRNLSETDRIYIDNITLKQEAKMPEYTGVNVYGARIFDDIGNEIMPDKIKDEDNFNISFDYTSDKNFFYAAAFYKDGALKDILCAQTDMKNNGFECRENIKAENKYGADTLKLFVLESAESLRPYKVRWKKDEKSEIFVSLDNTVIKNESFFVSGSELSVETHGGKNGILLKPPVMDSDIAVSQKKKYDSTLGGPESAYYINFDVCEESFLNRADGLCLDAQVCYFDEGYGAFTLEYDTISESLKEAEYVELNDTKTWKVHTFRLKNAHFTGKNTDFRLATWGEIMRYSNTGVVFSSVKLTNTKMKNQLDIKALSAHTGNIYYTGENMAFDIKISPGAFYNYSKSLGEYDAVLKYTILDENKNEVKTLGEKTVSVKPNRQISDTVTFNVEKYGIYYLKTEIMCKKYDVFGEKETEFSYVNSDKTTVNYDFGITGGQMIDGTDKLAKNAGIGSMRWVRNMRNVMSLTYNDTSYTLKEKGISADWKNWQNTLNSNGFDIINTLLAQSMPYSNQTKNGYKLHIPYGEDGRNLFAQYCKYFAQNVSSKYYEIWNEFDSPAGVSYNMNGEDYRNYGNLLTAAADAIYACDKDAEIISVVSGHKNTHEKAIKRVIELIDSGKAKNTLDKYFNIASAHPYHWNDNPLFAEYTDTGEMTDMYKHMKEIRDLYDSYNLENTRLYVTEVAWSPHYTAYNEYGAFPENKNIIADPQKAIRKPITEKQQGSYLVQTYVMMKKDNLVEKFIPYLFVRQTNVRVDRDKNMGILKNYKSYLEDVPLAATNAYLAISNMNMLLANARYVSDFYFDDAKKTAVCYRYKQDSGNDIAVLWSAKEEGEAASVNFGCNKITVYDEYGNASEMTSGSGIYNFNLTQSTLYVCGNFSEFKKN